MGHNIVQNILLIAGFSVVCILAITWLGTAILNKEADVASCIEESSTYSGKHNCDNQDHSENYSFTNDQGYNSRY